MNSPTTKEKPVEQETAAFVWSEGEPIRPGCPGGGPAAHPADRLVLLARRATRRRGRVRAGHGLAWAGKIRDLAPARRATRGATRCAGRRAIAAAGGHGGLLP